MTGPTHGTKEKCDMTDAERLAKAYTRAEGARWGEAERWPTRIAICQRLINSGVVTVNPPPDPAEKIADAWMIEALKGGPTQGVVRSLLADGWITPGPRCDQ